MLNVHSTVTFEYNYYVDYIISWKNRKENRNKYAKREKNDVLKRLHWIYAWLT